MPAPDRWPCSKLSVMYASPPIGQFTKAVTSAIRPLAFRYTVGSTFAVNEFTAAGRAREAPVAPLPISPTELSPQQTGWPDARIEQVWEMPGEMSITGESVDANAKPFIVSNAENTVPGVLWIGLVSRPPSCKELSLPQHCAEPSARIAHACEPPAAIATALVMPNTAWATG